MKRANWVIDPEASAWPFSVKLYQTSSGRTPNGKAVIRRELQLHIAAGGLRKRAWDDEGAKRKEPHRSHSASPDLQSWEA